VESAVRGDLPDEPRLHALCAFAVKLTREPASVADIDALRPHGLDDAAIHDAIQVIAYFNYINRVADAVGIEDEPEWADDRARRPRAW
jgi:uncharacterized peroxidase-related enzyme